MKETLTKKDIDAILRVDHAGETAAAKIYDGQLAILKHIGWTNDSTYEGSRTRTFRYV